MGEVFGHPVYYIQCIIVVVFYSSFINCDYKFQKLNDAINIIQIENCLDS